VGCAGLLVSLLNRDLWRSYEGCAKEIVCVTALATVLAMVLAGVVRSVAHAHEEGSVVFRCRSRKVRLLYICDLTPLFEYLVLVVSF
jgi:hypothetical protein